MRIQLSILLLFAVLGCAAELDLFKGEIWETGDVDLGNGGDSIFYYLFRARNPKHRFEKLVIWLSGGPGCSSTAGLFMENGPYLVNYTQNLTSPQNETVWNLTRNEYAWNSDYDVVFVDQPVGTGYSRVKKSTNGAYYCRDERCVARNFMKFLTRFIEVHHPEYAKKDLYITGESYAGHYIPAIALYLMKSKYSLVNLKAIAVGNGLTDMPNQIMRYPDFLFENGNTTLFDCILMKIITAACYIGNMYRSKFTDMLCISGMSKFADISHLANPYDIRRKTSDNEPVVYVGKMMNDEGVQKYFGIKNKMNISGMCDETVGNYMLWDIVTPFTKHYKDLLEKNVRVLLYHGDKDYICNWRGGETLADMITNQATASMKYTNFTCSEKSNKTTVCATYKNIEFKQYGDNTKFTYMRVLNSGHMVPMDQPRFALQILNAFIEDKI